MDTITSYISNLFSSYFTGPSLAWYIFVILSIVVFTRCRILTFITAWVPLALTLLFLIFRNDLDRGLNSSTFFSGFSVGGNIAETKDAPENSMAALQLALSKKNAVLFNVRMASDGAAVVIRDETTGRTTDKDLVVARTSSAELVKLNFKDAKGHIPLFKEMMDECRNKRAKVILEMEDSSQALLTEISDYVRKHDLYHQVVVTSSHPSVVFFMKRTDPRMLTGLNLPTSCGLFYSRFGASVHYKQTNPDSLIMKFVGQIIDDSMQILVNSFMLQRFLGTEVILMRNGDININFAKEAKARKMMVVAMDADTKTVQDWLHDVAKVPYFTRNLGGGKEE
ncbi:glycerophosphodiester phosphodiesterase family protein [Oesophagostomum dentatum]|uniref:Glycerophosphodiester phosphodiesterase family protein n=1 Tax=Oesophagostomum dentatum TaxID=61180 RepID=A0A0B1T3D3_OESDE|nr:glycerophosphodiester phosphodiesterase family protein [Oesophagostomum dentatum]